MWYDFEYDQSSQPSVILNMFVLSNVIENHTLMSCVENDLLAHKNYHIWPINKSKSFYCKACFDRHDLGT